MDETKKAYLELHIAVLLFGFTAIIGKWLSISAVAIVWWRVFFTLISFFFLINIVQIFREIPRIFFIRFLFIGFIVAIHWVTFYGAIKISNASITLICLATTSFMTSFIEPFILKRKIRWYEVSLGIMILPGMWLIVNQADASMRWGTLVGMISAFCAALFSVFNKKYIDDASPKVITAIEMFGGLLLMTLLSPFVFIQFPEMVWLPKGMDWLYLIILAVGCTTLAYLLSIRALRYISAFASNLAVNLEPVYGITMAALILKEHKDVQNSFYIGVSIILLAVFVYPFLHKRFHKSV